MDRSRWTWGAILLLFVVAFLGVFGPSVGYPFMDWDDHTYILYNPLVAGSGGSLIDQLLTPRMGYVVPVSINLQALLFGVGGGSPFPFHLVNVLMHLGSVALFFAVGRKLGGSKVSAGLAALLFAFHPLVAEPVAWATGVKDLLVVLMGLAGTFFLLQKRIGAAIAFGVLAALSKPIGAMIGFAWLGYAIHRRWLQKHEEADPGDKTLVAGIVSALVGAAVLGMGLVLQQSYVLDGGPSPQGGELWRPLMALGYHLHHAFLPVDLHPAYLIDRTAGWGDWHTALGLVGLVGVLGAAWGLRRDARGMLLWMMASGVYLPISNLMDFPRFLADSYLYAPMAFSLLLIPRVCGERDTGGTRAAYGVLAAAAVASVVLCVAQVERWRSNGALWAPLAKAENTWGQPWLMLGQGFAAESDYARSVASYEQFYARYQGPRHLSAFGRVLMEAKALEEAECVMVQDLSTGQKKQRAMHNLALFYASHEAFVSKTPGAAKQSVAWALDARGKGGLRWPEKLQAKLDARWSAVQGASEPWKAPQCDSLKKEERELEDVVGPIHAL